MRRSKPLVSLTELFPGVEKAKTMVSNFVVVVAEVRLCMRILVLDLIFT